MTRDEFDNTIASVYDIINLMHEDDMEDISSRWWEDWDILTEDSLREYIMDRISDYGNSWEDIKRFLYDYDEDEYAEYYVWDDGDCIYRKLTEDYYSDMREWLITMMEDMEMFDQEDENEFCEETPLDGISAREYYKNHIVSDEMIEFDELF